MKSFLISFMMIFVLSGCAEIEHYNAEQDRLANEKRERDLQAINEGLGDRCKSYGFRPGTDSFATCKQNEYHKLVAEIQRSRAVNINSQPQESYYQRQKRLDEERDSRPGINTDCRSTGNGNVTCYSR